MPLHRGNLLKQGEGAVEDASGEESAAPKGGGDALKMAGLRGDGEKQGGGGREKGGAEETRETKKIPKTASGLKRDLKS